ncbi:hypothetical protein [Alcanivorax sp.]|uniref:hypothetical protein n=1 Tax=Alcanivorax sp. TaxID=1872427 RepID=UPI0025BCC1D4|nr:hypothetical protein [Alcanivorax sp.]
MPISWIVETMRKQRLGFVGLGDDTASACLSMLKIMDGRSEVDWSHSDPDSADVLMISCDQTDETQRWERSDKPRIVVYHGNQQKPASPFILQHPFRVMQLLSVLDEVADTLSSGAASPSHSPAQVTAPSTAVSNNVSPFWLSLHEAVNGNVPDPAGLLVSSSSHGALYFKPASQRFYASKALFRQLAAGSVELGPLKPTTEVVPEETVACPLFSLCWMVSRYGATHLAPWMNPEGAFHLKRWPSFGTLEKSRTHLSLCALMTKRPLTREQLQQVSHCSEEELDRFINACEMSDLMVFEEAVQVALPEAAAEEGKGRFGGLIKGLRSRLGLSA